MFDAYRASFRRAAALHDIPIETVEIPFDDKLLSGYFMQADSSCRRCPTIIALGDRFAEELYFLVGVAGVSRGYNVLLADLPGQGSTFYDGLHLRADAETPVRAIVDYVFSRSDVDVSHIALYGSSFAGYMATRAVAYEKRITACIANTPVDDLGSIVAAEAPQRAADSSEEALRSALFGLTAFQAGVSQPADLFQLFNDMKVDDVTKISCPMLCLANPGDVAPRIKQTQKIYELLPNPKKALHIFTEEEGAGAHLQVNNLSLLHQVVFDWLDEVLTASKI